MQDGDENFYPTGDGDKLGMGMGSVAVQSSHTKKVHYPTANHVTCAHLKPKFQLFLSALDAQ